MSGACLGCVRVLAHNGFIIKRHRKGSSQVTKHFQNENCSMKGSLKTKMLQAEEALFRMVHEK